MSYGGSWLSFKLEYSDESTKRIIQKIRELGDETALTRKILPEIGNIFKQGALDCFKQEKDPTGKSWIHLRGSTIENKRRGRKRDKKPAMSRYVRGEWSGDLIKSIRTRTFKGKGNMVVVGSNLKYAKAFHYGDPNMAYSWGPVPARNFLGNDNKKSNEQARLLLYRYFREIWDQRRSV